MLFPGIDTPQGWISYTLVFSTHTVLWVELRLPQRYVQILTVAPVTGTLLGNRLFADVIKLRRGCSYWVRVGHNPVTSVLIRRGRFGDTDREKARWRWGQRLE